jgi:hypothetical protein
MLLQTLVDGYLACDHTAGRRLSDQHYAQWWKGQLGAPLTASLYLGRANR